MTLDTILRRLEPSHIRTGTSRDYHRTREYPGFRPAGHVVGHAPGEPVVPAARSQSRRPSGHVASYQPEVTALSLQRPTGHVKGHAPGEPVPEPTAGRPVGHVVGHPVATLNR